jgi:hypothetical protein
MSTTELELELVGEQNERDEVVLWRYENLLRAGFREEHARELARRRDVDLHRATGLVRRGCPPDLAYRILS